MLVLAIVTGALLAAPGPPSPRPPRVNVMVWSPQAPGQKVQFRGSQILDLHIGAVFPRRLAGPHTVQFKVYTPTGNLYQTFTVPFTGDAAPGNRRHGLRRVHGFPRALQVQAMQSTGDSGFFVKSVLPVAGTWITTNSLYGSWRVEAYLDGDGRVSGQAGFRIRP
jgi:hypothetical protein